MQILSAASGNSYVDMVIDNLELTKKARKRVSKGTQTEEKFLNTIPNQWTNFMNVVSQLIQKNQDELWKYIVSNDKMVELARRFNEFHATILAEVMG